MKITARRLSSLFIAITITVSLIVAALAPLFTTPSVAQTNPQSTDIFTGQFIPAYYGAAYDPTEAFKQMAGLTAYVFAYDTWGKIVNNFAYKTQIKADGSFQAAGLPNASHYGVCFEATDDSPIEYFRPPLPEDGIQSAFAYSQATLAEDADVNTQIADKPINFAKMNGEKGCRVFLTSSRQVDIANHINIFPLVPTSVLSVIIKDGYEGSYDFYNLNKPYEVYAQRVVINNSPESAVDSAYGTGGSGCDITDFNCRTNINTALSNYNAVAVGPVIRGRSIPYNPVDDEGNKQGSGTIFQAFAPRGVYAITYWRPDSRSSNAKVTYLTFDGISSLDTPYNGIAIETVDVPQTGLWKKLSTRSVLADSDEAWVAKYGTINAWGMATRGRNGQIVPQGYIPLIVSEDGVGFMDIFTRKCVPGNVQQYQTSADGLYIVSSACALDPNNPASSAPVQAGDLSTSIRALGTSGGSGSGLSGGGSLGGNGLATITFSEQSGLNIQINGRKGPSRRDIPLNNIPDSYTGMLQRDGKPFAFAQIDLLINGKRHANVAQSDSTGFFYIPTTYFSKKPYVKYEVQIKPAYAAPGYIENYVHTFALDNSKVLAAINSRGADLGVIAINKKQPSAVNTFLAGLSLDRIFKILRFPTAFAQQKIKPKEDDPNPGKLEMSLNEPWKFEIDLESLGTNRKYFNPANYHLKTVEINPPTEGLSGSGISTEYEYFSRNNDGEDVLEGAWLVGESTDEKTSLLIKGVQLKYNDDGVLSFAKRFKDLDTTYLSFNLRVRFEYRGGSKPQQSTDIDGQPVAIEEEVVDDQQNSIGQTQGFARVLEATWPVEVRAILSGGSGDIQNDSIDHYEVKYSPIVLDVEAPNCGGGSLLKDGFIDVVKGSLCKLVIGGINGIKKVINFLADNFLTVDPLNYPGSSIVIKYWNVIRNLVNSLAVLILLIAGVAIMLQYEPTTYNLQSVLKKLIISIVLVNFSILLIQIAVDIANVLSQGGYYMLNDLFETTSGGLANVNSAIGALAGAMVVMLATAVATGFTGFIGVFIFLFAIIVLLLYVSWKIIVQYFFRMATLWICIVLAPAAFAARVLPGTASYFGKWKNILVGALVGQAALALMLGLALAMISGIKTANGGVESFVLLVAAFVMLYMATRLPSRAAAMMGTDLSAGFGSAIKTGASRVKEYRGKRALYKERKRAEDEARKVDGMSKFNKFSVGKQFQKLTTGVSSEELDKERSAVVSEAQRYRRRQLEAERPGIVEQEVVSGLEEEVEKVELRAITARTGFSQSKFENYRNMADTGKNIDLSAGGKVEIGGAAWKAAYQDKSDFYKRMGGDAAGTVSRRYMDAITNAHAAGRDVSREDELLAVIEAEFAPDGGIMKVLEKKGLTFNELQGPHGARGLMLGVAADTATKVKPELNTDYNAIRNQLGRNTYDPRNFGPAAPPAPSITAPAVPAYSTQAQAWATRSGYPLLTTPPDGGLRSGENPTSIAADLTTVAALAHAAGSGTVLTPSEESDYSAAYRRLVDAGYRP